MKKARISSVLAQQFSEVKMKNKIGIIGFGNMGSALAEQLKLDYEILVFDKDKNKAKDVSGIKVTQNNKDLVCEVDTVVIAVKPQDFDEVLTEIKSFIKDKLVISIAAGISTEYIEKRLGKIRLIRTMPNLPAKIGKGMICLCKGKYGYDRDLDFAKNLFSNMGNTLQIEESLMDAATAISGSGPGFFYDFIETQNVDYRHIPDNVRKKFEDSLAEVARKLAFNKEQATILANATTAGSIALLEETKLPPSELKKQVASKGGTTEAGLKTLRITNSLEEAAKAALKRAKELSKG